MARSIPDGRFEDLVACATRVFIKQGYQRTQMGDVARAMGVAKGTLYLYVESKEALFDLIVHHADRTCDVATPPSFPIPTPKPGATVAFVRESLARNKAPEILLDALGRHEVPDIDAEIRAIVGELYDLLARNREGIKLIDSSARDHPELAALWFEGSRGGLVQLLTQYLDERVGLQLIPPLPDTAIAARLVLETTVFWAVHRHWDRQTQPVDETRARDTVLHFVAHALGKDARP